MASRVIVTTNQAEAHRVFLRFADEDASNRADRVLRFAKLEAPVGKTGMLQRLIRKEQSRDVRGQWAVGYDVISTAPYSLYVIKGTRPHPIVGNPLLAFFWSKVGANVVFRSVNHPGTKANDFLSRALRRAR